MKLDVLGWLRDRAVRRVVKFGLPVTIGKAATSVAALVTLALLARQLGPSAFGVLAVIRTVVMVVDQYANFNTWQAIVKFGTEAMADARAEDVRRVIKLGVVIDLVTGVVSAVVVAALAFVIPSVFGWSAQDSILCVVYGLTLVSRVAGASDGIFRICDAYRAQAIATTIGAFTMTAAIAVAIAIDASFAGCVIALTVGEVIGNVIVTISSFIVAREGGFGGWHRSSLKGLRSTFPGILGFMIATNAQLTVKKTHGELDTFVIGSMLGKISSGLFRVVKQLGTIPGRVFMPFEQVLFTELARLVAAKDLTGFSRLLRRSAGLALIGSLGIWAVVAVAAVPTIRLVAGTPYLGAVPAFRIYLLAMVLNVANAPVQRALIALGRPGTLFAFDLVTLFVLIGLAIGGAYYWGLVGVSAAVLIHKIIQVSWSSALVASVIRQRRSTDLAQLREPTPT